MVSFNLKDIVKPSINEIEKYIPGESFSTNSKEKIYKLSSNESPFKIPRKVINKVNSLVLSSNLYPDGDCNQLKNQLVKTFNLKFKNIICGNGSDDVLSVIAQTFSKEGGEVICSEFGFTYYPIIARASGCKVVIAKSDKLKISCDNILKSITKLTRIIFIANPNNPTGTIIFKEELLNFLQNVPKNIIVVLDGAYSEFIKDRRYTDGIELINKFPNIIVTRTFSKIFALAGLRLGWAYSNEKIIELLEKVRGPFNVNTLSQNIGTLILKEKEFLRKSIIHNDKWRKILPTEIKKIGLESYESFANFVLIKVNEKKYSKAKILSFLKKKKILVRDLSNYGMKHFFRVSIGSTSDLRKFLKELRNSINTKNHNYRLWTNWSLTWTRFKKKKNM